VGHRDPVDGLELAGQFVRQRGTQTMSEKDDATVRAHGVDDVDNV
jgi:hypothetical protein